MQLGIYSLEKILYDGVATSVNCNTKNGEITILDHHEPLISVLAKGVMIIIDENQKKYYIPVSSGFLEINANNQAKILVKEGNIIT